jgi:gluconokinase
MNPKTIIVMGVSGCGKSSIGVQLADALGGTFADADDFHPPANVEKMANGIPLTDADRSPWLDILRDHIITQQTDAPCFVLACSALKQDYRDQLQGTDNPATFKFVYLKGSKQLIRERMEQREHFMPIALLDSQFETLEEPTDAIVIDIQLTPDEIIDRVLNALH